MKNYWECTPDGEMNTGKNILRYYKEAAKLQIQMPKWTDADGNEKNGKCVTVNLDALRETAGAVEFLQKIFSDIA